MHDLPETIKRVEYPAAPNRCQQVIPNIGQCRNQAVEGGVKCLAHGGHKELESQRAVSLRIFRLGQWQARADEFNSHPNIKSLREEVGILRILLEERFAHCKSSTDLMLQAGPISDLVLKIEKVVASCHRLESAMGEHLEKGQLMIFAGEIVNIIAEVIGDDQEKLDLISTRILGLIGKGLNNES